MHGLVAVPRDPVGDREHRPACAPGGDPPSVARPGRGVGVRPGEGRCRCGRAVRRRPDRRAWPRPTATRSSSSRPTAASTCRAPPAGARPVPASPRTSSSRTWWRCSDRAPTSSRPCSDLFAGGVRLSDANRARVREACEKGNASVWASGSDPGFITETLPLALLSVQRRVDLIEIEEFGDLSHRPSPHMVMEQMRFGKPLAEFDPDRRKNHLFGEYQPPLSVLADIAGFEIDEWTAEGGVAAAKEDMTIVAGEIKAGHRRRAADHHQRPQRRRRPDPLHPVRLRRHGRRARLGPAAHRLADPHPRRRAVRPEHAVPRAARRPRVVRARVQRQRAGQRHPRTCARRRPGILTTEDLPHILPRGPRPADDA